MNIGVLGTGDIGRTLGTKLQSLGHAVYLGARTVEHEGAALWAKETGGSHGTFADAASAGEIVFNCTSGLHSIAALEAAGAEALGTKILVDVANPLEFSKGFPPTLSIVNDDSLGETIQRTFPNARVVKTLNTVSCALMVDPGKLSEDTDLFVSGNDANAKAEVRSHLREWFGWKNILDLGDITTARGTEQWLALWVRLYGAFGSADFNLKVVR